MLFVVQNYGPNILFTTIDQNRGNFISYRSKSVNNITECYINVTKLIKIMWANLIIYEQFSKIVEILYEIY